MQHSLINILEERCFWVHGSKAAIAGQYAIMELHATAAPIAIRKIIYDQNSASVNTRIVWGYTAAVIGTLANIVAVTPQNKMLNGAAATATVRMATDTAAPGVTKGNVVVPDTGQLDGPNTIDFGNHPIICDSNSWLYLFAATLALTMNYNVEFEELAA